MSGDHVTSHNLIATCADLACHNIVGVVLPLLMEQYKLHHQVCVTMVI